MNQFKNILSLPKIEEVLIDVDSRDTQPGFTCDELDLDELDDTLIDSFKMEEKLIQSTKLNQYL